jgi:hypothetical protein
MSYWPHSDPTLPVPEAPCTVCADRPAAPPSLMCGTCYARLRRDITTLVNAHVWLGIQMITPVPAWKPGTIGHHTTSSRPPYRLEYSDARDDIAGKLTSWARMVAEEHTPALAGPADPDPATVGRWLRLRTHWISEQDWCAEMCRELADAARAAYGLAPWERHRRDLPLPCPACGYLTLALYGGDELIVCRYAECGRELTWIDYWLAVKKAAGDGREILPPIIKPPTSNGAAA